MCLSFLSTVNVNQCQRTKDERHVFEVERERDKESMNSQQQKRLEHVLGKQKELSWIWCICHVPFVHLLFFSCHYLMRFFFRPFGSTLVDMTEMISISPHIHCDNNHVKTNSIECIRINTLAAVSSRVRVMRTDVSIV